jgi:hypothetical protein
MSVLTVPAQPVYANGVKSLCWGANSKVSRFFPKASAKSAAKFQTFVSVACFAALGLLMSLSVDWKFATRVEWLNGH